ncbi:11390_t:CDS:2, partial [Scutellospora calospora]
KEFGIMKKTLDLVILTERYDKLYEIHLRLSKEIEKELIVNNEESILDNNYSIQIITTINNLIGISSKDNTNQTNFNERLNIQRDELMDITNLEIRNITYNCSVCGQ